MSNTRGSVSSKHLEFRQKYSNSPLRVVFSTLFSVFGYADEILSPVFDILRRYVSKYRKIPRVTLPILSDLAGKRNRYSRVAVTSG